MSKMKNKKQKITRIEKRILVAQGVLVLGILVYLFFINIPQQIAPLQGRTILEPDFVFEIENGDEVIVSTNKEFSNSIILREDSSVLLPPGVYYWKVRGLLRESDVRSFTIQDHVGLNLKERGENYEIQNAGNVDLDLTKKNDDGKENFNLKVGENLEFEKDNSEYEGRQK